MLHHLFKVGGNGSGCGGGSGRGRARGAMALAVAMVLTVAVKGDWKDVVVALLVSDTIAEATTVQ